MFLANKSLYVIVMSPDNNTKSTKDKYGNTYNFI